MKRLINTRVVLLRYVEYLNDEYSKVNKIIYIEESKEDIEVGGCTLFIMTLFRKYLLANNISTIEGGVHVDGFKLALTRIINRYAQERYYLKRMIQ